MNGDYVAGDAFVVAGAESEGCRPRLGAQSGYKPLGRSLRLSQTWQWIGRRADLARLRDIVDLVMRHQMINGPSDSIAGSVWQSE